MVELDAEKVIENALKGWRYALDHAEYIVNNYGKGKDEIGNEVGIGDVILAQKEADDVASNTSVGSFYHSIMEIPELKPKYEKDFTKLWAKAKGIRASATEKINETKK